ncbi:NADH-quinone oxidoreductase subunit C, partial [bacterium]|nr:NADH-quinone oxidoreductase subunit C [bacterium]
MTPQQAIERLQARFGETVAGPVEFRGQFTVRVAREQIVAVCQFLKAECGFDLLTDLAGVDNYGEDPRFAVVYHLYSLTHHGSLRLNVSVPEDDLVVDTVAGVWGTADWHEREAFDMLGVRFRGHQNLKRILMWEGYPHYPLRKDFPLAGREAELRDTEAGAGRAEPAPMLGGPFVGGSGSRRAADREPRQYDTMAEHQAKQQPAPGAAGRGADLPAVTVREASAPAPPTGTRHEIEFIESAARAHRAAADTLGGEQLILNMGPSHPSTHGVLRLLLE